jgi:hypothetical protein
VKRLRWTGGAEVTCLELAQEIGCSARLEPGRTYTVPNGLAERLLRSHACWQLVAASKRKPKSKRKATAPAAPESETKEQ